MHRIEDVEKSTGLKKAFIHRCFETLDALKPFYKRGENNRIIIDDSGMVLFDKIKQLKEKKYSLVEISSELAKHLQNAPAESARVNETIKNPDIEIIMKANSQAVEMVSQVYDKVVEAKDETIKALNQQILLLSDGKTAEQIKQERESEQQKKVRLKEIAQEIESLSLFSFNKKKKLAQELKLLIV